MDINPVNTRGNVKNNIELSQDIDARLDSIEEALGIADPLAKPFAIVRYVEPSTWPYTASFGDHVEASGAVHLPSSPVSGDKGKAVSITALVDGVVVTPSAWKGPDDLDAGVSLVYYWTGARWQVRS